MTRLFETGYSATLNVDSFDAVEVQASPTGSWVHLVLESGEEFEAMRPTDDATTHRIYRLLVDYWLSEDLSTQIVTYKDLVDGSYEVRARAKAVGKTPSLLKTRIDGRATSSIGAFPATVHTGWTAPPFTNSEIQEAAAKIWQTGLIDGGNTGRDR